MPNRLLVTVLAGWVGALAPTFPASARSSSPFAGFAGAWTGGGAIAMTDGSQERIRCRAGYAASSDATGLTINVRCASDSYTLNVSGQIAASPDGAVTGRWSESTRNIGGDVSGRVSAPGQVSLALTGSIVTIEIDASTAGSRQTIALRIPGSEVQSAQISLRRN